MAMFFKKQRITSVGGDEEELEHLCGVGGNAKWRSLCGIRRGIKRLINLLKVNRACSWQSEDSNIEMWPLESYSIHTECFPSLPVILYVSIYSSLFRMSTIYQVLF